MIINDKQTTVKGSGRGLFQSTIPAFAWKYWENVPWKCAV